MRGGRVALLAVPLAVVALALWMLLSEDGDWAEGAIQPSESAGLATQQLPDPAAFVLPSDAPEAVMPEAVPAELEDPDAQADLGPPDLAGMVVRRSDGTPIKDVIVSMLRADQDRKSMDDFTDREGRFELRLGAWTPKAIEATWVSAMEVTEETTVTYDSDGKPTGPPVHHRTISFSGSDSQRTASARLDLRPGDFGRDDLLLRIDTGWNLTGYVGDDANNPLEGVLVVVGDTDGPQVGTGADGRLVIRDLPRDDGALHATVSKDGYVAFELQMQGALFVVGDTDGPQAGTGADGRFVIRDLPRDDGALRVTASKDGYVAHELQIESLGVPYWEQEVSFSLAEGGLLYGRVYASTGEGLPGAWVTVVVSGGAGELPREFQGLSKEGGRYLIDGIPPGTWLAHVRWDPSEANRVVPGAPPSLASNPQALYVRGIVIRRGQQTERDFELTVGAPLSGVVLESGGSPLARHAVQVWHEVEGSEGTPVLKFEGERLTGQDGRFEFVGLYPGSKQLRVIGPDEDDIHQDPGVVASKVELTEDLQLPAYGLRDVVLTVGQSDRGWIRGRVTDVSGVPLSGASILVLTDLRSDETLHAQASDDGTFIFRLIFEQELELVFSQPGYLPTTVRLSRSDEVIDLGDVVLDSSPGVVGLVVDAVTGQPVPEIQASFHFMPTPAGQTLRLVGTHFPDGTFRLYSPAGSQKGDWIILQAQPGTFQFWGDHPSGRFDLFINAKGYKGWSHHGELYVNEPPQQFLVQLERE